MGAQPPADRGGARRRREPRRGARALPRRLRDRRGPSGADGARRQPQPPDPLRPDRRRGRRSRGGMGQADYAHAYELTADQLGAALARLEHWLLAPALVADTSVGSDMSRCQAPGHVRRRRGCHRCATMGRWTRTEELARRVEAHVRALELIPPGGAVTCLVSGGADSTCLWHLLGRLGYAVDRAAREPPRCAAPNPRPTPASAPRRSAPRSSRRRRTGRGTRGGAPRPPLRRRAATACAPPATRPPTPSRPILYRLATSGATQSIKPRREDGVVRPLLPLWRAETEAYCAAHGLAFRTRQRPTRDTTRGLIRNEILPLLRRLHPAAEENILAAARAPARLPRGVEETLLALLADRAGSRQRRPSRTGITRHPRIRRADPRARPCPLGPVGTRRTTSRVCRYGPGDRAIGSPGGARSCKTCSPTPRSRAAQPPRVAGRRARRGGRRRPRPRRERRGRRARRDDAG